MTEELLGSGRASGELERQTAVRKETIRRRRQRLGIAHDQRLRAEAWLAGVRGLLGKVPDAEIARRVGKHHGTVAGARSRLGIPKPALRSRATQGDVRERLAAMSKAALRKLLAELEPIDAAVVRGRYLRARPETLAAIGARFGVSWQRVAQREKKAIQAVMAALR